MKDILVFVGLAICLFILILFPSLFAAGVIPLWKSILGFAGTIFVSCELLDRLSWSAEAEIAISLSDEVTAIKEASEENDKKDGE